MKEHDLKEGKRLFREASPGAWSEHSLMRFLEPDNARFCAWMMNHAAELLLTATGVCGECADYIDPDNFPQVCRTCGAFMDKQK